MNGGKINNLSDLDRVLFLVWAAPTFGSSRSRLLAQELGIRPPVYIFNDLPGSPWSLPLRYLIQGIRTLGLLFKLRPRVVLVQSPPSFAVWFVALYAVLTGANYIVDAHSYALARKVWLTPLALYKSIARRAIMTLVTDDYQKQKVENWGASAVVLRDPVLDFPEKPVNLANRFQVTFVNTFARDEPLAEVLQAAGSLPKVHFNITGRVGPDRTQWVQQAPDNVTFTDYLPEQEYLALLRESQAVMSLTTRDHTLQCGACEALSLARPVITSNWNILKDYFSSGTVHVDNTPGSIRAAVETIQREYDRYATEISNLRAQRRAEWREQISRLQCRIRAAAGVAVQTPATLMQPEGELEKREYV